MYLATWEDKKMFWLSLICLCGTWKYFLFAHLCVAISTRAHLYTAAIECYLLCLVAALLFTLTNRSTLFLLVIILMRPLKVLMALYLRQVLVCCLLLVFRLPWNHVQMYLLGCHLCQPVIQPDFAVIHIFQIVQRIVWDEIFWSLQPRCTSSNTSHYIIYH